MLIELSKEQLEYLVDMFDDSEEVLDEFEIELKEIFETALFEQDDFLEDGSIF